MQPRQDQRGLGFTGARVPLYDLFESFDSGATIGELVEWFLASTSNRFERCWNMKQRCRERR